MNNFKEEERCWLQIADAEGEDKFKKLKYREVMTIIPKTILQDYSSSLYILLYLFLIKTSFNFNYQHINIITKGQLLHQIEDLKLRKFKKNSI